MAEKTGDGTTTVRPKTAGKSGRETGQAIQANMQAIAERCKLSKVTVSRVFSAPHLVREATRDKVLAAAREMGYTYNALAGTLGRATRPFLGIIASHHNDSQFQSVMRAVNAAAAGMGLEALLGATEFDQEREMSLIRRYLEYRAAAIVVFGPTRWFGVNIDRMVPRPTCPILVIGEKAESEILNYIGVDINAASFSMVEYLHGLGHRRIALVCGPHLVSSRSHARLEGYTRGLAHFGLEPDQGFVYATRSGMPDSRTDLVDEGRNAVTQFLSRAEPPTAIVFPSDLHALGGMLALKERGVAVPGNMSVVSMSEHAFSGWIDTPLTTLRLPIASLSGLAGEFLHAAVDSGGGVIRRCLPFERLERASAAPPFSRA